MQEQAYREIELSKITTNPLNPRKNFAGTKFDELVESIRKKGVLEPILVRPIGDKKGGFQIVFGERRFRALSVVADENGGPDTAAIPALVKEISEDEAFDLMTIENLQREDLSELEEARSFKVYLDKKGPEALSDLAQRTGISERYIRRRVAVLELPKRVLAAWEKGSLKYGHLEQLLRVADKKQRNEAIADLLESIKKGWDILTVKDLKYNIDNRAPALKDARFNLEKAGCPSCFHNSDIQKKLFDFDEMAQTHCLNRKCFKQQQNNHLTAHWKKTAFHKKFKTNGFRFGEDVSYDQYHEFYHWEVKRTPEKCKTCENYVTLIRIDGASVHYGHDRVCVGKEACYDAVIREAKSKSRSKKDKTLTEGARVSWHGQYFREKFYQQRLPEILPTISGRKHQASVYEPRLTLFGLVVHDHDIRELVGRQLGLVDEAEEINWWDFETEKLWREICDMLPGQVDELVKAATENMIMRDAFTEENRSRVAEHVGIDLKKEWRITEEYLQKKTKAEIFAIAEKYKVFETEEAKTFLFEVLLKRRGRFKSCKKGELIRVFMESGVDLAGVVPDEILDGILTDEQKPLS